MRIDCLTFIKSGKQYTSIEDCLDLDRRSYKCMSVTDSLKRVVSPNDYLMVFETEFEDNEDDNQKDVVRKQLALLSLKVDYLDIYDNKITLERDFQWFSRHMINENSQNNSNVPEYNKG